MHKTAPTHSEVDLNHSDELECELYVFISIIDVIECL